ncbi:hypothetical protein GLOIN_2v1434041 [Rhizophagus clarus]|uniref:Tc1-like transposase DDE domain-containing protein n=1 Tax=Rhizophagus clarus TaxID=94130 RepID=A0A8H3LVI3_9GLOM|nr:hypothetical protein GLOIN_2v1434041 [Rhizophagus clarus]
MQVLESLVKDKVDWGKRYTILPALSLEGFIAVNIMEGSCDKERFKTFVLTQLIPQMNPYPAKHSVLVMDNARIHHDDDLVTAVEDIVALAQTTPDIAKKYFEESVYL